MPELPEVETFARRLAPAVGHAVEAVEVLDDRLDVHAGTVVGATIEAVRRRGKHIILDLGDRGALVLHPRMSGRVRLQCNMVETPYVRLVLRLSGAVLIHFVDPRRLGTVEFFPDGFSQPLGAEPLSEEFTPAVLLALARASRAPIKQLLLNQRKIAGLGNIYTSEALWRAGIDPRRAARQLSERETTALHRSIVAVLHEAIGQLGTTLGTSVSDYRPSGLETGSFQNHLAVYGRAEQPCERCSGAIRRVVQAGRSTYFCPVCQQ